MFSYRHAFHAGNHADVLKHLVLVATLRHLTEKDSALTVIDTHAGAGLYRLDGDMARTSAEAMQGVAKLLGAQAAIHDEPTRTRIVDPGAAEILAPALHNYLDMLASFNSSASGTRVYPGSPLITYRLLRPQADKLRLFELHPTDYRSLSGHIKQLGAGRMVSADCADGFERLKALLPPPNRRALVLIDPSYELKSDYGQVKACVQDALLRFPTGCYCVWYPIIPRPEAHSLPKKLKTLAEQAKRPWLQTTLNIGQEPPRHTPGEKPSKLVGLRASGMFIINPPHPLKADLAQSLPQVLARLGRGRGRGKGFTLV